MLLALLLFYPIQKSQAALIPSHLSWAEQAPAQLSTLPATNAAQTQCTGALPDGEQTPTGTAGGAEGLTRAVMATLVNGGTLSAYDTKSILVVCFTGEVASLLTTRSNHASTWLEDLITMENVDLTHDAIKFPVCLAF